MGEDALPPLNENGELPAGIYRIDPDQLRAMFGAANLVRRRAFARLMHVRDLAVRTGQLQKFFVFGSFVSAAAEPRDIDIVLVMASHFQLGTWQIKRDGTKRGIVELT